MPIIRKRNGEYAIRYPVDGKRHGTRKYESLGRISYAKAKQIYADRTSKSHDAPIGEGVTVKQLAKDYVDLHGPKMAPAGLERAKSIIKNHIEPTLGAMHVLTLRPLDVEKWRVARQNAGASSATVNREWNVLKAILYFGERMGVIDRMPIKRGAVPAMKSGPGRLVYFEPAEWRAFIGALDDDNVWRAFVAKKRQFGPVKIGSTIDTLRRFGAGRKPDSDASREYRVRLLAMKPLFRSLLWTGARLGEVLALQWQDIDLKGGFIHFVQAKTNRRKSIPLAVELKAELEAMPRGIGKAFVFTPGDGRPYSDIVVQRAFAVYLEVAGIKRHLTVHTIRHTHASWLVIQGVPIKTVQEMLGHADLRMTLRYAHLSPKHLRSALDGIRTMHESTDEEESPRSETDG